jgi:hypothetical protein
MSVGVIGIEFPIRLEGYCQNDVYCSTRKIGELYGKSPTQFKATVKMSSGHSVAGQWTKLHSSPNFERDGRLKSWLWQRKCSITAIRRGKRWPTPGFIMPREEGDTGPALIRWPDHSDREAGG